MTQPIHPDTSHTNREKLEKAVMEAIVGRNPVAYSKYGEETRDRLLAAIDTYTSNLVKETLQQTVDELEQLGSSEDLTRAVMLVSKKAHQLQQEQGGSDE